MGLQSKLLFILKAVTPLHSGVRGSTQYYMRPICLSSIALTGEFSGSE